MIIIDIIATGLLILVLVVTIAVLMYQSDKIAGLKEDNTWLKDQLIQQTGIQEAWKANLDRDRAERRRLYERGKDNTDDSMGAGPGVERRKGDGFLAVLAEMEASSMLKRIDPQGSITMKNVEKAREAVREVLGDPFGQSDSHDGGGFRARHRIT